jgi:protein SCO1/2
MGRKIFVLLLGLLVLGGMAAGMFGKRAGVTEVPPELVGTMLMQPRPLPEFALSDHAGATFDRSRFQGRWSLVFFGYTSCPDICPTTMLTLKQVAAAIVAAGDEPPQVLLVSVDPARDTPEALGDYVTYFGEDFIGVTGDEQQLHQLTLQVGAMYELGEPDETGFYEVAHSSSVFLIDPRARVVAAFSPPHQPVQIATGLGTIRALYAGD